MTFSKCEVYDSKKQDKEARKLLSSLEIKINLSKIFLFGLILFKE